MKFAPYHDEVLHALQALGDPAFGRDMATGPRFVAQVRGHPRTGPPPPSSAGLLLLRPRPGDGTGSLGRPVDGQRVGRCPVRRRGVLPAHRPQARGRRLLARDEAMDQPGRQLVPRGRIELDLFAPPRGKPHDGHARAGAMECGRGAMATQGVPRQPHPLLRQERGVSDARRGVAHGGPLRRGSPAEGRRLGAARDVARVPHRDPATSKPMRAELHRPPSPARSNAWTLRRARKCVRNSSQNPI